MAVYPMWAATLRRRETHSTHESASSAPSQIFLPARTDCLEPSGRGQRGWPMLKVTPRVRLEGLRELSAQKDGALREAFGRWPEPGARPAGAKVVRALSARGHRRGRHGATAPVLAAAIDWAWTPEHPGCALRTPEAILVYHLQHVRLRRPSVGPFLDIRRTAKGHPTSDDLIDIDWQSQHYCCKTYLLPRDALVTTFRTYLQVTR